MNNNAYIGIDLGTSGCRAIAINQSGDFIALSQQAVPTPPQTPPYSEQDPQQQWLIVDQVLQQLFRQLQAYQVINIAVDATSGSVMLADDNGAVLTPLLMYNDARAINEAELIKQYAPAESGAHGASSGLAKLLHLQHDFDLTANCKLLHQADWINAQLGADLAVTDYNNALKSGYDPINLCWPTWLTQLVPKQCLPKVVAPSEIIGQLSTELTNCYQLKNIPNIVAGTTDSIAAFLATGCDQLGDAVTSLGSTLVLKQLTNKPIFVAEQGIYSHRLGDNWLVGGASNSGGNVLKHFFNSQQLEELSLQIELTDSIEDYYPLISPGERFPILNTNKRPRITPRPKQDHRFLHSLLVGIAKIETQGYQQLHQHGAAELTSIRSVGGGASNQLWQTIRQQNLTVPFIKPTYSDAAYGAALLAQQQLTLF
ncbi:hypothetical protein A9Q92_08260 [Methylophaga sp. 42_8_T64]|nr:hypothetical protein A9Q92_08260 [Methylophaga sp. 42_8_T64]